VTEHATENIHPDASVDPSAAVDPGATIGPGVVIERGVIVGPNCTIGAGTRLRTRCIVVENVDMGEHNDVHPNAVIGGDPQDRAFDGAVRGSVEIGSRNIFREGATVSRSTGDGTPTRVGDDNYLMTGCHVGHNARLGNGVTMTTCASLGAHATVGDRCVCSSYVGVHQFTRVGELVMMRSSGGVSMHVPPYLVVSDINVAAGLNKVGLERSPDLTDEDRAQIKRVYRAIYRDRGAKSLERTVESLDATDLRPPARKFVDFVARTLADEGQHARGIIRHR